MKKYSFILMIAATALLAACTKELDQNTDQTSGELVPVSLFVESVSTKASLDGLKVVWNEGDQINVVTALSTNTSGNGAKVAVLTYQGTPGSESGVFSGVISSGEVIKSAVWPATDKAAVTKEAAAGYDSDGKEGKAQFCAMTYSIPSEQIAVKGGY